MTNYDYFTRTEAKEKILDYLEDNRQLPQTKVWGL